MWLQALAPASLPSSPLTWQAALSRLLLLSSLSAGLLMADDFIQQLFTPANQAELSCVSWS